MPEDSDRFEIAAEPSMSATDRANIAYKFFSGSEFVTTSICS